MASVHMGVEVNAFLSDLSQRGKREDLKAAAVGEDRPVPGHEAMQPAHLLYQSVAGPDVKMIGVGQLDLAADLSEIARRKRALDRALRADVHKDGRLHRPVRRRELAPAGVSGLLDQLIQGLISFNE